VRSREATDGNCEAGARAGAVDILLPDTWSGGRPRAAIGQALFLASKTVEGHIASIFSKLALEPVPEDHRRVLAVLAYLRSS
jgi:hypothetical protein